MSDNQPGLFEPTPVEGRLIDAHCAMLGLTTPEERAFNHSILCQTSLPYRVKADQRYWFREHGCVEILIQAGAFPTSAKDSGMAEVGLPYGPKARLVFIHLISHAVKQQNPVVPVGRSLTEFVRLMGIDACGRNIRVVREQLRRLAACTIRLVTRFANHKEVLHGIVDRYEIFEPREPGDKRPWVENIRLTQEFYNHLERHAVPLDPRALNALQHSASALDTYQWLAQRLCKVPTGTSKMIPWKQLFLQLGGNTQKQWAWKQGWLGRKADRARGTLDQVLEVYPAAREAIAVTDAGLEIRQTAPPVGFTIARRRRVV